MISEKKNEEVLKKVVSLQKKKSFFKKRKKLIILAVLIILGAFYFYSKNQPEKTETIYTLTAINKGSVFSYVSASGQISSLNQAEVKAEVNGKAKEIKFSLGDEIKKGDVLAVLENKDLERKLIEAQNSLAIARNNLNQQLAGPSEEEILNAKISYENSKTSYENSLESLETIKRNADDSLRKAEQDLNSAQRSFDLALNQADLSSFNENQDISSTYNSAKSNLDSSYSSLKSILISADSILGLKFYNNNDTSNYEYLLGAKDSATKSNALNNFYKTKSLLEKFEKEYVLLSNNQDFDELVKLLEELLGVAESSKDMMAFVYNTLMSSITSADFSESQLNSLKQSASSGEASSLSIKNSIFNSIQSIEKLKNNLGLNNLSNLNNLENSRISLENSKLNLEKVKTDNEKNIKSAEKEINSKQMSYDLAKIQYEEKISLPKEIDLLSYRTQVSQAEANYEEAKENLENLTIVSPINGKIAKINFQENEDVDSGASLFTLISDDNLLEAVLNEVDIAKVKVGQKAIISISALSDLSLSGEVIEVDNLGTTNQGVVSYGIKILIDISNEQIKPQMSASAEIITAESISVLTLANSALKSEAGNYYVEYFSDNPENKLEIKDKTPERKYVEIGLVGDSLTEIKSGLEEGELIVLKSQTNTSATKTTANTTQTNLFNMGTTMPTGNMGGGPMRGF